MLALLAEHSLPYSVRTIRIII